MDQIDKTYQTDETCQIENIYHNYEIAKCVSLETVKQIDEPDMYRYTIMIASRLANSELAELLTYSIMINAYQKTPLEVVIFLLDKVGIFKTEKILSVMSGGEPASSILNDIILLTGLGYGAIIRLQSQYDPSGVRRKSAAFDDDNTEIAKKLNKNLKLKFNTKIAAEIAKPLVEESITFINKFITLGKKCQMTYPTKVPIIATFKKTQHKFLVEGSSTVIYFLLIIKEKLELKSTENIYAVIDNRIVEHTQNLSYLHKKYQEVDNCLHIHLYVESIFGKK